MKIQERVFKFANATGRNINPTDTLLVAINGKRSEIKLIDLFDSYKQKSDRIIGHSILGEYNIDKNCILVPIGEVNFKISLINKNNDEDVFFTKISFPMIQSSDKECNPGDKLALINNEINRLFKSDLQQGVESVAEHAVSIEGNEDDGLEDDGSQEGSQLEEQENENGYLSELKKLTEQGYKEFIAEEYRVLFNEKEKKAIVITVEDDNYLNKDYDVQKTEVDYTFIMQNGDKLTFDKTDLRIVSRGH